MTFLPVTLTEVIDYGAAIDDLHAEASTDPHDPGGLPQDRFVLVLCVEESECIEHDRRVGALGSERQLPHVTTDPVDPRARCSREMLRAAQQGDGEVETDNLGPAFRQGDRVSPMTAPDVNDAGRG